MDRGRKKLEKIREIKSTTRSMIISNEKPEEIDELVDKAVNNIFEVYKIYNCANIQINKYIEGSKDKVKSQIKKILEGRNNEKVKLLSDFFSGVEKQILEGETEERKNTKNIREMELNNGQTVERIEMVIESALEDIKGHQNRILSQRGYEQRRIDTIQQGVNEIIKHIKKNQLKIQQIFEKDNEELKELITKRYQEYIEYEEKEERKSAETENKQTNKNERQQFQNNLDAKISLEEQNKNAQQLVEKQAKEKDSIKKEKSLPDNVIY